MLFTFQNRGFHFGTITPAELLWDAGESEWFGSEFSLSDITPIALATPHAGGPDFYRIGVIIWFSTDSNCCTPA